MLTVDRSTHLYETLRNSGAKLADCAPMMSRMLYKAAKWVKHSVKFMLQEGGRYLTESEDGKPSIPLAVLGLMCNPYPITLIQWKNLSENRAVLLMDATPEIIADLNDYGVNLEFGKPDVAFEEGALIMISIYEVDRDFSQVTIARIFHPSEVTLWACGDVDDAQLNEKLTAVSQARSPIEAMQSFDMDKLLEEADSGVEPVQITDAKRKGNVIDLGGKTVLLGLDFYLHVIQNAHVSKQLLASYKTVAGYDATIVADFLAAINCSNVTTRDVSPPWKLNAKRIKNGKPPFSVFKTLVINVGEDDGESAEGGIGGHHSSPRLHLRRCHLRNLASGKCVMVKAHTVGRRENGTVVKDYSVEKICA